MAGQRFWMTVIPRASASAAASAFSTPSCIQTVRSPGKTVQRLFHHGQDKLGPAEDIHHVHRRVDVGQARPDGFVQHRQARMARIDRDHPIAMRMQELRDPVAGAQRIGRPADQRNHARRTKNFGNFAVQRHVGISSTKKRPDQRPGAKSRNEGQ